MMGFDSGRLWAARSMFRILIRKGFQEASCLHTHKQQHGEYYWWKSLQNNTLVPLPRGPQMFHQC